jgi:hypothetical protein
VRRRAALIAWLLALTPGATLAQGGDASDNAIDDRIRASAAAAESFQGPLDGAWTLVSTTGQALYAFEIVDRPGGRDPLEGAWRDLRHPGPTGEGFVDAITRGPDGLIISFSANPGDPQVTIKLNTGADGAWSGDLKDAAGDTPVRLRRG